jgi:CelD/BcsL family acetyltransferase involved in cellulose biosynthesis
MSASSFNTRLLKLKGRCHSANSKPTLTAAGLTQMFRVERITGAAALEALVPQWEALDRSAVPRTPFTSPLWNCLWWRHFREQRAWVRDEFFLHAVFDDERLVGVAPLMRTARPAVGPLRLRELQLLGADQNVTELRGVLCRPEDHADVMRTLHAYFLDRPGEWDRVQWCGLRADASVGARQPAELVSERQVHDYYLPLPATWDELRSRLSRNMRESLRKCYKVLANYGTQSTFRVVSRPTEVGIALGRFFELHGQRARTVDTVPHADVFATARARAFLCEYAQRMAERDQLRIFELEIAAQIVASRVGFVLGDELYLYYSGYAHEWHKSSVMTTVVAEAIRWAIGQQFKGVNLSTGNDRSKTRWKPNEIVFCERVLRSPGRRGRLLAGVDKLRHAAPQSILGRVLSAARRGAT